MLVQFQSRTRRISPAELGRPEGAGAIDVRDIEGGTFSAEAFRSMCFGATGAGRNERVSFRAESFRSVGVGAADAEGNDWSALAA